MRIRAAIACLSGALALSALAVPAAQADEGQGDTHITGVVVNGGKPVVIGTTTKKTFSLKITATDDSGISDVYGFMYHGTLDDPDGFAGSDAPLTCTKSATTATAGTWKVLAAADANDGDYIEKDIAGTGKVLRQAQLTVNASPEPVKKGATLTATGKLSRASWDTNTYGGFANQPVKLQFRKAGTSTYTTVKTVYSSSTGTLKTTTTASADGYWRFSYAGTSTTSAVNATGDYVDVQ
jgi:hypothetical protein